jgi:hypothetical protein
MLCKLATAMKRFGRESTALKIGSNGEQGKGAENGKAMCSICYFGA